MKKAFNSDPNSLTDARPEIPVGSGGVGEAAGSCGSYGTTSKPTTGNLALDLINRTTGKNISDTGNPPYNGGLYNTKR